MLRCELRRIRTEEFEMEVGAFANFLEVNFATYQGWERENSRPTLEVALDIAEKLKRQVEEVWHK